MVENDGGVYIGFSYSPLFFNSTQQPSISDFSSGVFNQT